MSKFARVKGCPSPPHKHRDVLHTRPQTACVQVSYALRNSSLDTVRNNRNPFP